MDFALYYDALSFLSFALCPLRPLRLIKKSDMVLTFGLFGNQYREK